MYALMGNTIGDNGNGNGSSWQNASDDIQLQIEVSTPGDTLFVAGGVYKPTRPGDNLNVIDVNNRKNAIILKKGLKLFGSFPTTGSPAYEDRNFSPYPSVISGDIGNPGDTSDNCFHLILCVQDSSDILLDWFVMAFKQISQKDKEHSFCMRKHYYLA